MAFDEFLTADQIKASKKRRSETREATTRTATSSSSIGSALSSDDDPICASARPHAPQPARGKEILRVQSTAAITSLGRQPLDLSIRSGVIGHPWGTTLREGQGPKGRGHPRLLGLPQRSRGRVGIRRLLLHPLN